MNRPRQRSTSLVVPLVGLLIVGIIGLVIAGALAAIRNNASLSAGSPQPPGMRAGALTTEHPPLAEGADLETWPTADLPDPTWVIRTSELTGVPERALRAYAGAAMRNQEVNPRCELSWNTLAGIGRIESFHGVINDNTLSEDGTAEPGIFGIPLNGDGVAAIADTDGGELDGDSEWDRAVGPMQFIPETWSRFGTDANGSGEANPQNIDDAALSAAFYLCDRGQGALSEAENWVRAVRAYNNSSKYINDVAERANNYATSLAADPT